MSSFDLFIDDLPDELKVKIAKAHKAGISPKLISKYLKLPLREVEKAIREEAELAQWQSLMAQPSSD